MRLQLSGRVFAVCGLWLAALGVYFLLLRPALLPEDPRFMGASIETLRAAAPGLERWLGHVFNVMGGFMIATGSLATLVACRYLAIRARGTLTALVATGTASVGLMSATNFMLHSDFRWLLLVPAPLWLMGVVCYLREGAPESTTGVN
ncbi:MAG: hypothetical protein Q8Q98_02500 [Polaromonas sp.]|nr:hypothetical protein [Polaromonas sp.]